MTFKASAATVTLGAISGSMIAIGFYDKGLWSILAGVIFAVAAGYIAVRGAAAADEETQRALAELRAIGAEADRRAEEAAREAQAAKQQAVQVLAEVTEDLERRGY